MIQLYGYNKCGTCRKSVKYLEGKKIPFTFIDITENPPSASTLKKMMKQSGLELKKYFNTSGLVYKAGNYKDKLPGMSESTALKELSNNGRLIKRPLITDGKNTTVGYNEDLFKKTWKK